MALDGPSPVKLPSAVAVGDPAAGESAGQASQRRVASGFLNPHVSPGRVLADGVKPIESAGKDIQKIPTWQLHDDAGSFQSGSSGHPVAQGATPKSATPARSTEVRFDPATGTLQKGTLEGYLNDQLRKYGGAFFTDSVRDSGNVSQVKETYKNLANLISHAEGVKVLYTDLVDDQAALEWLVGYDAPGIQSADDGGPPREADLDKLVDKIIARRAKEHPKDPAASRTGEKADTRAVLKEKVRAYVGMLRTVQRTGGIEIRILKDEIKKAKPVHGADGSVSDTYVIVGSGEKENKKVGGAGLPIFEAHVEDDVALMSVGVVTKFKGQNKVMFDPAVLSHQTTKSDLKLHPNQ